MLQEGDTVHGSCSSVQATLDSIVQYFNDRYHDLGTMKWILAISILFLLRFLYNVPPTSVPCCSPGVPEATYTLQTELPHSSCKVLLPPPSRNLRSDRARQAPKPRTSFILRSRRCGVKQTLIHLIYTSDCGLRHTRTMACCLDRIVQLPLLVGAFVSGM
jgi:hypothetical protein